jgi:hypothetical protein
MVRKDEVLGNVPKIFELCVEFHNSDIYNVKIERLFGTLVWLSAGKLFSRSMGPCYARER